MSWAWAGANCLGSSASISCPFDNITASAWDHQGAGQYEYARRQEIHAQHARLPKLAGLNVIDAVVDPFCVRQRVSKSQHVAPQPVADAEQVVLYSGHNVEAAG